MAGRPSPSRVELATWPTPLEGAPRLAAVLGLAPDDLWLKRDDLTGLGGGGNKVRKLEYTCAAALANGARRIVTTGAAQSNHARLTAAAGARLGLGVLLVLAGSSPETATGNIALDGLLGADIEWAGDVGDVELERIARVRAQELSEHGVRTEVIPFGGSNVAAAHGYVDCGYEIIEQSPEVSHVVVALGSGATMAGLVYALGQARVLGVDTGAVAEPRRRVQAILDGLFDEARDTPGEAAAPTDLRIRDDQVGEGYATLTPPAREALQVAAHTEGVILDPIYTGRALAGLARAVADGHIRRGERTVFIHTGGLPGFFGHPSAGRFGIR